MRRYHLLAIFLSVALLSPSIVCLANERSNSVHYLVADMGEIDIFGYPFLMHTFFDKTHNAIISGDFDNGTYQLKVRWTIRLYNDRIVFPIRVFCGAILVHHINHSHGTYEDESTATLYRAAPGISQPSLPACVNITVYSKPFKPDNLTGWFEVYMHVTVFPTLLGFGNLLTYMIDMQRTIEIQKQ